MRQKPDMKQSEVDNMTQSDLDTKHVDIWRREMMKCEWVDRLSAIMHHYQTNEGIWHESEEFDWFGMS